MELVYLYIENQDHDIFIFFRSRRQLSIYSEIRNLKVLDARAISGSRAAGQWNFRGREVKLFRDGRVHELVHHFHRYILASLVFLMIGTWLIW